MISQNVMSKISSYNYTELGIEGLFNLFKNCDEFTSQLKLYKNQKVLLLPTSGFYELKEEDDERYPVAIMNVYIECTTSGCSYTRTFIISPFACYLNESFQRETLSGATINKYMTKFFREYMIEKYGDFYKNSCIKYIKKSTYNRKKEIKKACEMRISQIEEKQNRELEELSK